MAQSGSASALGAEGRGFKSLCPDQPHRAQARLAVLLGSILLAAGASRADSPQGREVRLAPEEIAALASHASGAGTSGVSGIRTTVLTGDPTRPGLYAIRLAVPAHTAIAAHSHRDERSAVVLSGTWYFGYGSVANEAGLKRLPAGSFYSEPAGVAHFARTLDEPVVVYITGYGPTDTRYVDPANDPRSK